MTVTTRRIACLAAAAALLAAPAAHAQIPGADDTGTVVITDGTDLKVSVNPAGAAATSVTGRIANSSSHAYDCYTPGANGARLPGQVTEAAIVDDSVEYYRTNIYSPGGLNLPVSGVTLNPVATGSLFDMMPTGSVNKVLGTSISGKVDLRAAQAAARLAGHTGDPLVQGATTFTVPARGSVSWGAQLGQPNTGVRTDFAAAVLFFCTDTTTGKAYVFAGHES